VLSLIFAFRLGVFLFGKVITISRKNATAQRIKKILGVFAAWREAIHVQPHFIQLRFGFLQLHTEPISQTIDESKVGRYGADVMNSAIVKSKYAQSLHVFLDHVTWRSGEFDGIAQHGLIGRYQFSFCKIGGQRRQQLVLMPGSHAFYTQQSTETLSVVMQSVAALVFSRHDNGNHFTLDSAQRPFAVHQLLVQIIMLSHCPTVNAMDSKNIVPIRNKVIRRDILLGNIIDEGHLRFLFFVSDIDRLS
jgi:hypothetical protein